MRISLQLIFFFIANVVFGQDFKTITSENEVATVAYWKKGDSRKFHVSKEESKYKKDSKKPFSNSTLEYDLDIRVLEEQDSSYLLQMVYSNYHFPDKGKGNEMIQKFSKLSEGLKIVYRTDEIGIYDSIVNKEDLADLLIEQLDKLVSYVEPELKKESDKELFQSLFDHYKEMFSKPENIDVLYAEDILRMHGYYGLQMKVAKPVDVEMIYPALNNFVLNGTGTITLNDINKSNKTFTFLAKEEPNEDEVKKYLSEIFEVLTMDLGSKKPDLEDFQFETNTKHRFTMDLRTCWLVKSTHSASVKVKIGKSISRSVSKTTITSK